jgi:hypothetical protein
MSNAVRAGVVTGISPTQVSSSVSTRSLRTIIPFGGRVQFHSSSTGTSSSTHSAPCKADAATPVTIPLRFDHNQAPTVLSRSDKSRPFGAWMFG